MLRHARVVLPAMSALVDDARRLTSEHGTVGRVHVGTVSSAIGGLFASRLHTALPGALGVDDLLVTTATSWSVEETADRLASGTLDVALVGMCGDASPPAAGAWCGRRCPPTRCSCSSTSTTPSRRATPSAWRSSPTRCGSRPRAAGASSAASSGRARGRASRRARWGVGPHVVHRPGAWRARGRARPAGAPRRAGRADRRARRCPAALDAPRGVAARRRRPPPGRRGPAVRDGRAPRRRAALARYRRWRAEHPVETA